MTLIPDTAKLADYFAILAIADIDIESEKRQREQYGDLDELSEQLRNKGQIQTVAVQRRADGRFLLIAGGRRIAALIRLEETHVLARIFPETLSELDVREMELMENRARLNLSWDEEVKATNEIHRLQAQRFREDTTGSVVHNQENTAALSGVSRATVQRDLELAAALENPQLKAKLEGAKNKADALKRLSKVKEAISSQVLAEKVEAVRDKNEDTVVSTLSAAFRVSDVFEGLKSLADASVDFILIDPPYAIDTNNVLSESSGDGNTFLFKEVTAAEYPDFVSRLYKECFRVLKPDRWCISWFAINPWYSETYKALSYAGFNVSKAPAIWIKPERQGRNQNAQINYTIDYEPFFYARKGNATLSHAGASSQFRYQLGRTEKHHPTQKPRDLTRRILTDMSQPGQTVLIPFLGSGEELIACYETGRNGFGFELVSEFRDQFLRRLIEHPPVLHAVEAQTAMTEEEII